MNLSEMKTLEKLINKINIDLNLIAFSIHDNNN
ncbi:MAG: hypothetical protein Satyrvirus2_63 [Satyrvirus sp.]|uniref:Uncharacterized protein n=1 Tax=Satyrvirus sp. TaxID=2487771 RepID=A0A3G5AD09_9VIRU|nr:MAG: hypothetical protein Satyrvirus2_63 [Satyrvirus sp.]